MTSTFKQGSRSLSKDQPAITSDMITQQISKLQEAQQEVEDAIESSVNVPLPGAPEKAEYLEMADGSLVKKLYRGESTFNTKKDCSPSDKAWRGLKSIARKIGG